MNTLWNAESSRPKRRWIAFVTLITLISAAGTGAEASDHRCRQRSGVMTQASKVVVLPFNWMGSVMQPFLSGGQLEIALMDVEPGGVWWGSASLTSDVELIEHASFIDAVHLDDQPADGVALWATDGSDDDVLSFLVGLQYQLPEAKCAGTIRWETTPTVRLGLGLQERPGDWCWPVSCINTPMMVSLYTEHASDFDLVPMEIINNDLNEDMEWLSPLRIDWEDANFLSQSWTVDEWFDVAAGEAPVVMTWLMVTVSTACVGDCLPDALPGQFYWDLASILDYGIFTTLQEDDNFAATGIKVTFYPE